MEKLVSAVEANRQFSQLLQGVRGGDSFVITSHGKPVARLIPMADDNAARTAFRDAYFRELAQRPTVNIGKWTRDELYER